MPYNNIWKDRGLNRTFTKSTSGQEVLESNLALHGDERFDRIDYVINDFLGIAEFEVSKADIEIISTIDNVSAISKKNLKIAIIATNSSLLEWINLYLEKMQGSAYECSIFSQYDDAYQWATQ